MLVCRAAGFAHERLLARDIHGGYCEHSPQLPTGPSSIPRPKLPPEGPLNIGALSTRNAQRREYSLSSQLCR